MKLLFKLGVILIGIGFIVFALRTDWRVPFTLCQIDWTALFTLILVIATLAGVYWQLRLQRILYSADTLMKLHERFESMAEQRRDFSRILLKKYDSGVRMLIKLSNDDVIVFFETMGLLTHKKTLDKNMVWNEFCWEIVRYYGALTYPENQIERLRKETNDSTLYDNFIWLNSEMLKIDSRRRKKTIREVTPNEEDVDQFLKEESTLERR